MDITDALAPVSDQLDAIELVNPRTFTIDAGSRLGKRDGKTVAEIRLVDFPRVWRPSKGMLDVLAGCWGTEGEAWVGRRVTVYNDPDVMFGRDKVGGIRISHLSHIDGPRTLNIRGAGAAGRKQPWRVNPLPDATPAPDVRTVDKWPDLFAGLRARGLSRDDALAYCASVLGRGVTTTTTLTRDEASRVLDAMVALGGGGE